MDSIFFSGVFDLPWWGHVVVALALTHITIVSVTVFLHRHQAHHALDLHPAVSHFFRMWLWLTTGMVTREWAAVHRKHHAKCDTPEDPHSPQVLGLSRVLWSGVFLYVKAARKPETIERYEFDIGWLYIRVLEMLGVARVKHVAPIPHFTAPRPAVDPQTLQAVIKYRYDVLAQYAQSLRREFAEETGKLWKTSPADARALETVEPWLDRDEKMLHEPERTRIAEVLPKSRALYTMYAMRRELAAVWGRSTATREQLVKQLQDWCRRAEASGIRSLMEFSQRLRSYA